MLQAQHRRTRADQGGFALLLVFAMAAVIAILMYIEMPRVAFEHQRDKEALLVDRGEQYVRAIQLYARRTNRFPQTLDDLEKAMNIRFLRRRYKDPMTNSEEWRLIHVNALGLYTDSKVQNPGGALDKTDSGPSVLASNVQGIGDSATLVDSTGQGNTPAYQRRASDRIIPGGPLGRPASPDLQPLPESSAGSPDANQDQSPDQSQDQTAATAGAVQPPAEGQQAGFNNPFMPPAVAAQAAAQQAQQPGNQGAAGATGPLAQGTGGIGGVPRFGIPMPTGRGAAAQAPADAAAAGQTDAGAGSVNQPGAAGASTTPPAIQAVQQVLGSQNVGASASGTGVKGAAGPSSLGAGLAGVASRKEEQSIRVYKNQANYSLWEFIFDPRQAGMQNMGGQYSPGSTGIGGAPGAPTAPNPNASFGGMAGGTPAPAGPPHD